MIHRRQTAQISQTRETPLSTARSCLTALSCAVPTAASSAWGDDASPSADCASGMSGSSGTNDAGTLYVLAAAYDTLDAALIDYEAVKRAYHDAGEGHDFDASVVACDGDGGTHVI